MDESSNLQVDFRNLLLERLERGQTLILRPSMIPPKEVQELFGENVEEIFVTSSEIVVKGGGKTTRYKPLSIQKLIEKIVYYRVPVSNWYGKLTEY